MNRPAAIRERQFLRRLQCALPLSAYARPMLLAFVRRRLALERTSPRLTVTNVFHAGDGKGLMCQFLVEGAKEGAHQFVAPIEQLAFERWRSIAQDIGIYRNRRNKNAVVSLPQDNGPQSCLH